MLNLLLHLASLFQQEGGVNKEATWTRRRRQQGGGVMNTGSGAENYISKHWSPATCLSFGTCPSSDGVRGGGKNSPPPSHLKFSGFRNFWRTHNKVRLFKIQDLDRSASSLQPGIFFYLNWGSIAFVVLEFDERLRSSWYSLTKEGGRILSPASYALEHFPSMCWAPIFYLHGMQDANSMAGWNLFLAEILDEAEFVPNWLHIFRGWTAKHTKQSISKATVV